MKGKASARRRINAEAGTAGKLASLTGIDGLAWLTDEEADRLVECFNYLDKEAVARAFNDGWASCEQYNADMRQLEMLPTTTLH